MANALAGDRHYDGMVAPDGTDISTRTKHREYMKRNGLTTADDFTQSWKKDATERQQRLSESYVDPGLRKTIERELYRRM